MQGPPRSRCEDRIKPVRDLLGEMPVKGKNEEAQRAGVAPVKERGRKIGHEESQTAAHFQERFRPGPR